MDRSGAALRRRLPRAGLVLLGCVLLVVLAATPPAWSSVLGAGTAASGAAGPVRSDSHHQATADLTEVPCSGRGVAHPPGPGGTVDGAATAGYRQPVPQPGRTTPTPAAATFAGCGAGAWGRAPPR
jgi:hypothetical protein